ncbi:hypothetical protein FQZ97_1051900 [compost metagenome]
MIKIAFFADRPIRVIRPTLKNTSFGIPRRLTAITAPSTPSGTTSNTEVGIDQLSYSAARHRNTTSNDKAMSIGAWAPDKRSCSDRPVHSRPMPGGNWSTRRWLSSMSCPELKPGAGSPDTATAG